MSVSTPTRATLLRDADALAAWLRGQLAPAPTDADAPPVPPQLTEEEVAMFAAFAPGARQAAVLAPLYARDGAPYLLFTERSATLSKHGGQISFPGGSRDREDATLGATALREAYEELALDPARVALLGTLPSAFSVVSNFIVTPYVGWLGAGLPALTPSVAEVAEVIEAPLATLADPATYHSEVWERMGTAHTIHFYDIDGHRIWGLTGRILYTLLALLPAE